MLGRSFVSPVASRTCTCVTGSILAPAIVPAAGVYHRALPPQQFQAAAFLQDSGRGFSCSFPFAGSQSLVLARNPFYALHVQTVGKATLPRDPERPQVPLSAYLRFAAECREKRGVKSMKDIGASWKQLGLAEKQPFQQAAASANATYQKEFEAYTVSGKRDAWKRDPVKPKKPLTPFFEWAMVERKSAVISKLPVAEAAKALGSSWAKVPQSTKDPMTAKYKTEMEQYITQMKSYKDSGAETSWLEKTGRLAIQKNAEAKKQAAKDKISMDKAKKTAQAAKEQEKKKAIAAKAKEQSKLRKEKMQLARKRAKAKLGAEKAKTKAVLEKKASAAKAKEQSKLRKEKMQLARERAKAKSEAEKAKTKAALEKKKAASAAKAKAASAAKAKAASAKEKAAKAKAASAAKAKAASAAKAKAASAAKAKAAKEKAKAAIAAKAMAAKPKAASAARAA